ncbi:3-hydroxyacyl-CoA dehydrogenase family protein [Neobacillus mesonae]|uniref:3-hydroxybutyryl-CoA dehydrogenase n=1 Tax=Neobacillus mesonae TaxID=1193713 RepID=A0A3T0HY95_9BACI|nr:3-hydroxyacyl-CoA dehydrogenase family protein [Neobacillus mesonae]AZU62130.1 3-hydroxybutyryl-CoA dehydrogenase [Neobacillus mesonae]
MIQKATVIGSGVMGHGIAQVFALVGIPVHLYDLTKEKLRNAFDSINKNLDLYVKNELISPREKEQALKQIQMTTNLEESLVDSKFVIEAIPEVLQLKWDLYRSLETICTQDVIIASNTSTIPLTTLIQHSTYPERFIIAHFLNPAPLVPLVEVIKHECTSKRVIDTTMSLLKSIGKTPILLKKEIQGFVVNRIQAALLREALALIDEDIVSMEDMDKIIKDGPGFRWAFIGPIETVDFGGLDTWKRIFDILFPDLDNRQSSPEFINKLVAQNKLGSKTGEGIYPYKDTSIDDVLTERDSNFLRLLKIKAKQQIIEK